MTPAVQQYNASQEPADQAVCELLMQTINQELKKAENKIWHAHPVWFLDGNPIVGYSKQKKALN